MRIMSKSLLMPLEDAFSLLSKYDIPFPPYTIIKSSKDLVQLDINFEYPVVLKIISHKIIHKTDVEGIKIGIKDPESLFKAIREFESRFGEDLNGFLIQKMVGKGIELSLGGVRDPVFGPLVMFGSGGIFVELFRDVSFRLAPVNIDDAVELIQETKAYKLLQGFRDFPKIDIYKVVNLIIKVSNLIWDNKNISELDINPLIVGDGFEYAVDVRIVLEEDETK